MKILKLASKNLLALTLIVGTQTTQAEFKRFSVSAGWMHVMPQGKANPFNINTIVNPSNSYNIGPISTNSFIGALDPNASVDNMNTKSIFEELLKINEDGSSIAQLFGAIDENGDLDKNVTGAVKIKGLDQWRQEESGLKVEDVDTLGLTFNYYLNDNVSLQIIGGIPPKVDIKGEGVIFAPMTGLANPQGIIETLIPSVALAQDIPITNLGNKSSAATVRAWTPVLEAQYQFGKSGVNKFRPYIGVGIMYAYFSKVNLNGEINSDLIAAGHMVKNILDNQAGAALDGKISSANPYVKVKASDAVAPIISIGATYDFKSNWYGIASISYAKLDNKVKIDVIDRNNGEHLISASNKVEIDPIITYLGIGYRF